MKTTRFFRYLWRINAILIFLAALLLCGVLGFLALEFMDFGGHSPEQAVQVDAEPKEEPEPPTLGAFCRVDGTPFLRADLTFGDRYSRGSFSNGGAYSTRNYLFFNLETAEAKWLFSSDKQLVLDSDELHETIQKDDSKHPTHRAIAFSYQTIDADTNGDNKLTSEDGMSLAYSRPDGREYTSVIKGIDSILSADTIP